MRNKDKADYQGKRQQNTRATQYKKVPEVTDCTRCFTADGLHNTRHSRHTCRCGNKLEEHDDEQLSEIRQSALTGIMLQVTVYHKADAGIVISASHNPFHDNGIKFFGGDGYKLPDAVEDEIEARELARIIGEFLDTLTLENRVIFMRRYWFADSYKDIAELVGISEKNISVRLTRIRQKMKSYLAEREVFV